MIFKCSAVKYCIASEIVCASRSHQALQFCQWLAETESWTWKEFKDCWFNLLQSQGKKLRPERCNDLLTSKHRHGSRLPGSFHSNPFVRGVKVVGLCRTSQCWKTPQSCHQSLQMLPSEVENENVGWVFPSTFVLLPKEAEAGGSCDWGPQQPMWTLHGTSAAAAGLVDGEGAWWVVNGTTRGI